MCVQTYSITIACEKLVAILMWNACIGGGGIYMLGERSKRCMSKILWQNTDWLAWGRDLSLCTQTGCSQSKPRHEECPQLAAHAVRTKEIKSVHKSQRAIVFKFMSFGSDTESKIVFELCMSDKKRKKGEQNWNFHVWFSPLRKVSRTSRVDLAMQ